MLWSLFDVQLDICYCLILVEQKTTCRSNESSFFQAWNALHLQYSQVWWLRWVLCGALASLLDGWDYYSIPERFCLSAIYLWVLSTEGIAEYKFSAVSSQRLSRTFFLWTFSTVCLQGEEVRSTRETGIKANFFLSTFTFVRGEHFYQGIQFPFILPDPEKLWNLCYRFFLSITYVSNTGPGDRSYWWKQKLVSFLKKGAEALKRVVSESEKHFSV